MLQRLLTLSLCLLGAVVSNAQEDLPSRPRNFPAGGISIQIDYNPFRVSPTIAARIRFIDRSSPSLGWFTVQEVTEKDGKLEQNFKHEKLKRILALSAQEIETIDSLFAKRIKAHKENMTKLDGPMRREVELELVKKGAPANLLQYVSLPEPEPKDLAICLKEYEQRELVAEKELVAQLDEFLPPQKLAVLVYEWWNVKRLFIPIVANHLQLNEEQIIAIKLACDDAEKLERQIVESYKGSDINERNALLISNAEWQEAKYRPFSYLTPSQFRIAASGLLKSWKTVPAPTFAGRLEFLDKGTSLQEQAELEVLGELYRRGAKLESGE